jgi:predicted RNA binding protein YcfA (HicA-like mRNA interferase family)
MPVKVRGMLKQLATDGWVVIRQRGSHRQLAHPTKPGTVTVAGQSSDTLSPGTERSTLRQAGLADRI